MFNPINNRIPTGWEYANSGYPFFTDVEIRATKIAITPDGKTAYVKISGGYLVQVSLETCAFYANPDRSASIIESGLLDIVPWSTEEFWAIYGNNIAIYRYDPNARYWKSHRFHIDTTDAKPLWLYSKNTPNGELPVAYYWGITSASGERTVCAIFDGIKIYITTNGEGDDLKAVCWAELLPHWKVPEEKPVMKQAVAKGIVHLNTVNNMRTSYLANLDGDVIAKIDKRFNSVWISSWRDSDSHENTALVGHLSDGRVVFRYC